MRAALLMAAHEQSVGKSDEWYTPPCVFDAMDVSFDLDVAHPGHNIVPWVPTTHIYSSDALTRPWLGMVWMNPPFGKRNAIIPWLEKFFAHGDGVALTPDRTSCPWWQTYSARADAIFFWAPKIHFIPGEGVAESSPAQGTTLMAAGPRGVQALRNAAAAGRGRLFKPIGPHD